jgi:16S rRNA (guanine966-N2)-methyltransferase
MYTYYTVSSSYLLLLFVTFDNINAFQSLVATRITASLQQQKQDSQRPLLQGQQHQFRHRQWSSRDPRFSSHCSTFSSEDNYNNVINSNSNSTSTEITALVRADRPIFIPEIPANLRRKIQVRRAKLGHVVPKQNRGRSSSGGSNGPQLRKQGIQRDDNINSPNLLRVASGVARGRKLLSPNVYLRPMMGKVREAVFSTFQSFGLYDTNVCKDMYHLDIFSGSGSVGIESLSRGAKFCTFIDLAQDCCDCAQRNLEMLGFTTEQQGLVIQSDAISALQNPYAVGIPQDMKFNLITICPPYEEVVYGDLLDAVAQSDIITDDTIVMIEYPIELGCLPPVIAAKNNGVMLGIRNRKYGRTVIAMYIINPTGNLLDSASSRPEEFILIR